MSIGGLMRTSVSGMNAQANRLSGTSDNIANASTTGYKKQQTEFSSMVLAASQGQYNSGAVEANTRTLVSQQGGISYTTNKGSTKAVDLAIQGNGFLIVGDAQGDKVLTRAGAFRGDGSGNLVNSAGYILQGYRLPENGNGVLNGYAGLENVRIDDRQLINTPTTSGILQVNLDKRSNAVPSLVPGTGTTAQPARAVQGNVFGISTAPTTAEKLTFSITLDGETAQTVEIAKPATGFETLTAKDVVDAINEKVGGSAVAFVGTSGQIILASTKTPTVAEGATAAVVSSIELSDVKFVTGADETVSGGAIRGLDTIPLTSGKPAVAAQYAGTLASQNRMDAAYTSTRSISAYDRTGAEVIFDVYMTKTGDDAWEYAIFNRADRATGATAPFPYANGPVTTMPVTFNADGAMISPADGAIRFQVPNGELLQLNIAGTTQKSGVYEVNNARMNGNPPERVNDITIDGDGTVYANFGTSGARIGLFKIPLAQVQSPDSMEQVSGNAFRPGLESGSVLVSFGGQSGLGNIVHGALEESTVDLASELTSMIESQRSYTANSKVFQTGSEILDVLVNLKR